MAGKTGSVEADAAALKRIEDANVKFVSLQFVDIMGVAKACEVTPARFADALENGRWFDGSSIEGYTRIFESDMLLKPDVGTMKILPGSDTASVMCDVYLDENKPFEGDPRFVLKRAMKKAQEAGFEYKVGPELEFFFFKMQDGTTRPTPDPHDSGAYFDLSPLDLAAGVRKEAILLMESIGIEIEMGHHEVAPGQHEIDFKYGSPLVAADSVLAYKAIVKSVAMKHGLFASFMPKPISGINGSGMHVHQSLWKGSKNAFYDDADTRKLSKTAYSFIAGQLSHARELSGVLAPTVNSYKRLVPGYEAPVYVCWGTTNRSALIRIPKFIAGREYARRAELRCPDPSCNPYLAFAAMLYAGMDGVMKGLTPPAPMEEDVFEFDEHALASKKIGVLPGSLGEATKEMSSSALMKEALGEHVHGKLIEAQKAQWNEYLLQVTPWEIEKYLGII